MVVPAIERLFCVFYFCRSSLFHISWKPCVKWILTICREPACMGTKLHFHQYYRLDICSFANYYFIFSPSFCFLFCDLHPKPYQMNGVFCANTAHLVHEFSFQYISDGYNVNLFSNGLVNTYTSWMCYLCSSSFQLTRLWYTMWYIVPCLCMVLTWFCFHRLNASSPFCIL